MYILLFQQKVYTLASDLASSSSSSIDFWTDSDDEIVELAELSATGPVFNLASDVTNSRSSANEFRTDSDDEIGEFAELSAMEPVSNM